MKRILKLPLKALDLWEKFGLLNAIKLNVANAALRTVDFKGGLDKFLISAKNAKLSKKVRKIKASISAKS